MRVVQVRIGMREKRSNNNFGSDERSVEIIVDVHEGDDLGDAYGAGSRAARAALREAWGQKPVG